MFRRVSRAILGWFIYLDPEPPQPPKPVMNWPPPITVHEPGPEPEPYKKPRYRLVEESGRTTLVGSKAAGQWWVLGRKVGEWKKCTPWVHNYYGGIFKRVKWREISETEYLMISFSGDGNCDNEYGASVSSSSHVHSSSSLGSSSFTMSSSSFTSSSSSPLSSSGGSRSSACKPQKKSQKILAGTLP